MHVLQVVRPAAGGMRRHVEELCRGLPARGIECTLAAPPRMLEGWTAPAAAVPLDIAPGLNPWRDALCALRLARMAPSYDLVHCHGLRGAWIGALASYGAQVRPIVTLHNMPPSGRLVRLAIRLAAARSLAVIAVSQAIASVLTSANRPYGRSVHVIPNGVALPELIGRDSARRTLGLGAGVPLVLAAGRLEREKGFDVLLDAAARLQQAASALVFIVGEGSQRTALLRQAARLGLTPRVSLPGFRTDLDLWYEASDVVVVPSRTEGQGIVALEAMSHQRPVIATRVGGLPEVVVHEETGLLVPPDEPDALATAVERLLGDPLASERMGHRARERITECFSRDAMLDRVADVYRKVLTCETAAR